MSLFSVFVFLNAGFGVEFCFPFDKPSYCVTVLQCGRSRFSKAKHKNLKNKNSCQTCKSRNFQKTYIIQKNRVNFREKITKSKK